MKSKCAVATCSNSEKSKGIVFHSFPSKNDSSRRREAWIEACNRGQRFNADSEKVCQIHFSGRDYCLKRSTSGGQVKELRSNAIPHLELGIIIQATKPPLKSPSRKKVDDLEPGEIPKNKALETKEDDDDELEPGEVRQEKSSTSKELEFEPGEIRRETNKELNEFEDVDMKPAASRLKDFQGDDDADDDYEPDAEELDISSDVEEKTVPLNFIQSEHGLETAAETKAVKISFTAKNPAKTHSPTASKRSLEEMEEPVSKKGKFVPISPESVSNNQTIIKGPKKVVQVLLKKISSSVADSPATNSPNVSQRPSRTSKTNANSFLKQVTTGSKSIIDSSDDEHDYSTPTKSTKQVNKKKIVKSHTNKN